MKERPILFNDVMVRAILEGRKTQTRRPINSDLVRYETDGVPGFQDKYGDHHDTVTRCPFGQVGDRLWVRECWGVVSHSFDDSGCRIPWISSRPATKIHELPYGNGYYSGHAIYRADGDFVWGDDDGCGDYSCWNPSIYMPRRASRITLEITGVRVERLQNISEEDAKAEGVFSDDQRPDEHDYDGNSWMCSLCAGTSLYNSLGYNGGVIYDNDCQQCDTLIKRFKNLWQSTCGPESWSANHLVWVIEFEPMLKGEK